MKGKHVLLIAATAAGLFAAGAASAGDVRTADRAQEGVYRQDDASVTAAVKDRLSRQGDMDNLPIAVTTNDGVVSISGYVGTIDQMARVVVGAAGVDGVERVDNQLNMIL
ncbi:MAG TPA: BON domain-containing protein [Steroidobacteraceae bacterium]|jgi:hyperosmotically inducible protein